MTHEFVYGATLFAFIKKYIYKYSAPEAVFTYIRVSVKKEHNNRRWYQLLSKLASPFATRCYNSIQEKNKEILL